MRNLNYNHLRYFWAVAHAGGLTRAAEQMSLSQSAISVQIQKLEHQIGHALFDRVGKKLVLTEAGQIALDYADTVFQAGEDMMGTLQGRALTSRPVLRVGALTTLSRNFQLEFLKPLVGRADVELIVRSGTMRDLLSQLETHALDVVLANSTAPRDAHALLRTHLLNDQPVSLVGRPLASKQDFAFPGDLTHTPVLLPSQDSDMRLAFDKLLDQAGIRPIILAEVDDMAMLRLLARDCAGVTLAPPIVVRDELTEGVLVEYVRIPEVRERFYAIVQKRRFPNALLNTLLSSPSSGEAVGLSE